jgi:hypothetical protein
MPANVFAPEHWSQVLELVIFVNAVNVVNVEPRMQKLPMGELPDDVRAPDIASLVGIGMNWTVDGIAFAQTPSPTTPAMQCNTVDTTDSGHALIGVFGEAFVPERFDVHGGADFGACPGTLGGTVLAAEFGMTLTTPPLGYAANMLTHTRLYPLEVKS